MRRSTDRIVKVLSQLAARIVLLEALFLAFVFLMMLAQRGDGPSRRAFDADWPLSGLLILASLVTLTYAGFALLRTHLYGASVRRWAGLLNVLSVVVVALLNAWSFLSSVQHQPTSLPGLYIVVYFLLLASTALAALGASLAIWSSWRARGAGSITA